jgi:hypothetical protein
MQDDTFDSRILALYRNPGMFQYSVVMGKKSVPKKPNDFCHMAHF